MSTIEQQREQILHVLRKNLNPTEYRSVEGLLRSSIRFFSHRIADECDLALGTSKVGGLPDLPPATPWPVVEVPLQAQEGLLRQSRHLVGSDVPPSPLSSVRQTHRALPFLCQIALADIAPLAKEHLLPEDGLLLFFADVELDLWIDIARGVHEKKEDWRAWKVIYVPAQSSLNRVFPPDFPYQLSYHPCTLSFQHEWCLPDEENPLLPFYREVFASIAEMQFPQTPDEPVHRLLGYDQPIQGDVSMVLSALSGSRRSRDQARRAMTAPWQLLLQLDTDERAGMKWGDSGRLYFCLSQQDMQIRRFEHSLGLWQQF